MLIIYSALVLGGIETFFVRLCEQRYLEGKSTKVLLLFPKSKSDPFLISRLEKIVDIYYLSDITYFCNIFFSYFPLLALFRAKKVKELFSDVSQIHVTSGRHAVLANHLQHMMGMDLSITIGVYHSKEFAWKYKNCENFYFEKTNRRFILDFLPKKNIFFFSDSTRQYYTELCGKNFTSSQIFRLGVINHDITMPSKTYNKQKTLKIVSIGRLVKFKQYNLWMLDIIYALKSDNIQIIYDIYGTGPLYDIMRCKINELNLQNNVFLKGNLPYNDFNSTVLGYDIFVGSGTAIVQASALGIVCIAGIESEKNPVSYGFFHECYKHEYHRNNLTLPKVQVLDLIHDFLSWNNSEKILISKKHVLASKDFGIEQCSLEFSRDYDITGYYQISKFKYVLSELVFFLYSKMKKFNRYS